MKKYILAKDLPDHPAGTPLEYDTVFSGFYSTPNPKNTSTLMLRIDELERAIEQGWVKEVDDRRKLKQHHESYVNMSAFYVSQSGRKKFTPEEVELMEKALNGELIDVDLKEFAGWFMKSRFRAIYAVGQEHAELLEAFNAREK
jgi:hypothetical protein